MQMSQPQSQHQWLHSLIGSWTVEGSGCGEEGKEFTFTGTETVRAIGDLWIVGESQSRGPDGTEHVSHFVLGFDERKQQFVGSWVSSMMAHMWVYEGGSLDDSGKVLTLPCDGPNFEDPSKSAQFKDVITIVDADRRMLSGHLLTADGTWHEMMTMRLFRA